jgi:hypothetical protein
MSHLQISNEDPVDLECYFDSSSELQLRFGTDNLVDYDQEIWCEHDTNTSITVRIFDLVDGSTTWEVSAEHENTTWRRASDHAWCEFTSSESVPLEVEVTVGGGSAPPKRPIKVKPQPQPQGGT